MTTRIESSGSLAQGDQEPTACQETPAGSACRSPIDIEPGTASTEKGSSHGAQTRFLGSPDPMSRTDRYRLVTPYKLSL